MKLPEICIRRPVLAIVMNLILMIIGAKTFEFLDLREYPKVDQPTISVTTQYTGASPNIVEARITKILESAFAGIEGLHYMKSSSESENSKINLFFHSNRPIDAAASDVRDRLSRVRSKLPEGLREPQIKKTDADAQAIISVVLYGKDYTTAELYDFAHHYLESELEAVPGVAGVEVAGSPGYAMHVWLDPVKMAGHHVTTHDVSLTLRQQNVHTPAGRLIGDSREFQITTPATLKTVDAFNDVVVKRTPEHLVRLKDVARAEFTTGEERNLVRYNEQPTIDMELVKKSTANPLEISRELNKMLPEIRKKLPPGMELKNIYDKSIYISESLKEVKRTFFEATICVIAVILLFLWSWRATLIPLVTIPVSVITTMSLLYVFGFSLNTLTLLAIVLAIGLVVDDAIVVMENVHRYLEEGLSPMNAAIKGSSEIAFAVIAMTLTLAAVYAPIALSKGIVGMFFTEFAITLAGSVVVSGFVALTLSPMMCAYFLKPHSKSPAAPISKSNIFKRIARFDVEKIYGPIERGYYKTLRWVMKFKFVILVLALAYFGAGLWIAIKVLPSELAPKEDQGTISIGSFAPNGATTPFMDIYMRQAETLTRQLPEIKNQLTLVGPPSSRIINTLTHWDKRKRTSMDLVKLLKPELDKIPGFIIYASPGATMISGGGDADQVQFVLKTNKSQEELDTASALLEYALRKAQIFPRLNTDRGDNIQEYTIDINRDKAGLLGIDINTIGETFEAFVSGRKISDYRRGSELFDVIISVKEENRRSIEDLSGMYVRGTAGQYKDHMIPLSNLVTIKKDMSPVRINHFNQLLSVTLSGALPDNISLGTAVTKIQEIAEKILPQGIQTEFTGETQQYLDNKYDVFWIFGLAIVFIYLIMAAQFESFKDPLIIMFTVPLSLAGAVITLKLVGGTINIYSQIGLITLIGLITKHGILIVDFANKIQENEGKSIQEAVMQATKMRLRPILMTTAAMVLGAIPLVLASGAGAVSRQQIGWVIFGGMLLGTFFTLYVIPLIYTLLAKKKSAV